MNVRWTRLALVAASLAALTGCVPEADASPGTTPPVTVSTAPTPTVAPSSEPSLEDPDDPATWVVDGAGIGPLHRGAVFDPAAPAAGPYAVATSECPNPAVTFLEGDGVANLTVVTEQGGPGIAFVQVTSWGTSGDIVSPSTTTGVELGASVAELQAAYPGIEHTGMSNNSAVFAVQDVDGSIVFLVEEDAVVVMAASPTSTIPSELCG